MNDHPVKEYLATGAMRHSLQNQPVSMSKHQADCERTYSLQWRMWGVFA